MSWYYTYYLCIHDKKENTIEPLGPYDCKGSLKDVLCLSRSFASDLWDAFYPINGRLTERALEEIYGEDYVKDADEKTRKYWEEYTSWLPLSELPEGSFIKKGYYLTEDIDKYESGSYLEDIFWEHLDATAYARKLENELKFGKPEKKYDIEGEELPQYSCADYSYYAYPEYQSKEYEAWIIRQAADILCPYGLESIYKDCADNAHTDDKEICVVCTQG